MATKTKITFKTEDVSGKEISLDVRKPTTKTRIEADKVYNKAFLEAKNSGFLFREQVEEMIKECWTDAKQKRLEAIDADITSAERAIRAGGIKKSECRKLAIKLSKDRNA